MDKRQLVSDLQRTLEQRIPGPEFSISQPVRDNILESISQIKGQVVIKVSGSDLDVLNQHAQAILVQVRAVDGVEARSSIATVRCRSCRSTSTATAPRATA